jgi:FkbM family methyltransferase
MDQQRLASLVDTLTTSQKELRLELEGGKVVIELISTLRDLAKWAASGQETQFYQEIRTELDRVLHELQGDVRLRDTQNSALVTQAGQASVKLDALLTRQAIPLATLGLVLVRNRLGLLAIQDDDAAAIAYYLSGELPEAGTIALVERLLSKGDCFVDVGANVGIYSLLAGRIVGPTGKVIAVEPMPITFNALRTTLAVNGMLDIVDMHECALGSRADTLRLYSSHTSGHSSLLEPAGHAKGSDDVTIKLGDEVLAGARPKIIKIDVEGWELEVLEGLRNTIEQTDGLSIIMECSPIHIRRKHDSLVEWMERIKSFGLRCWRIDDDALALSPMDDVMKIDDRGTNVLLSRRLDKRLEPMLKRHGG